MLIRQVRTLKTPGYAFLHGKAKAALADIPAVGVGIMDKVDAHVLKHGIEPAGPVVWMYEHWKDGKHVWVRAGIMVPPRAPAGRLRLEKIAPWTCFHARYRGSMTTISQAWMELIDKAAARGLKGSIVSREVYRKWVAFDSPENVTELQLKIR